MPPRRRLNARARRQQLLETATAAFAEHGYDHTSMRTIARRAGVTTPILYDHFASKAALHRALLEAATDSVIAHQGRPRHGASPEELARALFDDFFAWVEAQPFAWRMLFHDDPTEPEVAAALREARERSTAQIAGFVAAAPALDLRTGLAPDVAGPLVAESIHAVISTLARWWWEHRDVPRDDVAALAHDVLWRGLGSLAPSAPPGGMSLGD